MASGDTRCFKVRAVSGGLQSGFSNEWCVVRDMIYPGTGAASQPTWRIAFGDFASDDITLVTSVAFANLKRCTGHLYLDGGSILASANLDALVKVDLAIFLSGSMAITSISLPALTTVNGQAATLVMYNGVTPTMIQMAVLFDGCSSLTAVSIPNLVYQNGRGYLFDGCALNATSVNAILARARASGVTGAFITLDGGTNAAPTGQGIADKAFLLAAGNSVSTN